MPSLSETGAALLGGTLRRAQPLHGGDLSQAVMIELTDGRKAVVKSGPAPMTEAAMLKAIKATGAPAPTVLAASAQALAIEVLATGGSIINAWESLGAALATLHAARGQHEKMRISDTHSPTLHAAQGQRYGWEEDYAFAQLPIKNAWCNNWSEFWSERRLLPHLPHVPLPFARRIEALARTLGDRLPSHPASALLHGDLWSGNILAAGRHITGLIDPACYYGHGEVDLAMLGLFGPSPASAFYNTYGAPQPGHEERRNIYQLWPALVHLRLFGSGYQSMVKRLLTAAGV